MSDMLKCYALGRLTKQAELKQFGDSGDLLKFSIAVNRKARQGGVTVDQATFWNVEYWSRGASGLAQYMIQGRQVVIVGDMVQEQSADGRVFYKIRATDVQLVGNSPSKQQVQTSQPVRTQSETPSHGSDSTIGGNQFFEDDIPF